MDGIDPNLLQRCNQVGRRGGTCDDGGDGPLEFLYLVIIDEADLLGVTSIKIRSQSSGMRQGSPVQSEPHSSG